MNYRTISDMNVAILKGLHIIPRDFNLIVGIPRSGMFPANLMALYLNLPYTDLDSFINGHIYKAGARGGFFDISEYKRVLVVDDSVASGSALQICKEKLAHLNDKFDFKYCVVYVAPDKKKLVDYYFEAVSMPRYFQWNILNHTILQKSCFDIDGVLCVDPTEEDNDDGEKYINFILTAPPLFVPGCKIGTIVTSRLEKYRKETEEWLVKNKIKYDSLVMLDLPNKEARQKANSHAQHKAKEYMAHDYKLFVESSMKQAVEINLITKKPVLCTDNFEMIFKSKSLIYSVKSGRTFPLVRHILLFIRARIFKR